MAASTSTLSTKLSVPLRHLLLRRSVVTLSGKLPSERALSVFPSYQKPVLAEAGTGIGAYNMMLFKRVTSPLKRKDPDEDDADLLAFDDSDDDDDADLPDFEVVYEDSDDFDVPDDDQES